MLGLKVHPMQGAAALDCVSPVALLRIGVQAQVIPILLTTASIMPLSSPETLAPSPAQACVTTGAVQLKDPATGANFVNNQIPTNRFVAPAVALFAYVPTSSDACGKNYYSLPNRTDEYQYIGRGDWTINTKQTFFSRYFRAHLNQAAPAFNNNVINTTQVGTENFVDAAILGHTWSITPNVLIYQPTQNYLQINASGFFSVGSAAPAYYITNAVQIADDVDIEKKNHHLMFGFNGIYNQLNYNNINNANGTFSFNGSAGKLALADLLLGVPSTFTQGNPAIFYPRQKYMGAYLEDEIHMSTRLTLHAGVSLGAFSSG